MWRSRLVALVRCASAGRRQFHPQRVTERRGDLFKLDDLLRVRLFVDAIERRNAAAFQIPRHRFVGGEHEFFDHAMGKVPLRARDAHHAARLVKLNQRLGQVEINRASLHALAIEDQRELFHQLEVWNQRRISLASRRLPRQDVAHSRVSHALGAADDARRQFVLDDSPLRIDLHQRRHHQAFDVGIEAADAIGKLQRQHGHGAVGKINRRAPQSRLAIERRAGAHVMGHVGDVHVQQIIPIRPALHQHSIVKILGRFAVDGHDGQIAEVTAAFAVALGNVLRRAHRPPPAPSQENDGAGGICG